MPSQSIPSSCNYSSPDDHKQTGQLIISTKRLEGKLAIISGGANGIGEATTIVFTAHGAKVVIADIEDLSGVALANALAPSAVYIRCDVSSETDVRRLIDETLSRFHKLDIIFNNGGVLGGQSKERKSIVNLDTEELDRVMGVNVRGTALGMKHAARAMVPRRSGCIISTASVAGIMGGLGPHAYTASKHAIVGLTKNAACELGRYGIRVNCVSPFGVAAGMLVKAWRDDDQDEKTEISGEEVERTEEFVRGLSNFKLGVSLKVRDVAEAALYLASDDFIYVSGHNLVVDGAFTTSNTRT